MPQPIYIPEPNDPNKKGVQGSTQVQGTATITTEDIEKKLSQLNLLEDTNQIQT